MKYVNTSFPTQLTPRTSTTLYSGTRHHRRGGRRYFLICTHAFHCTKYQLCQLIRKSNAISPNRHQQLSPPHLAVSIPKLYTAILPALRKPPVNPSLHL